MTRKRPSPFNSSVSSFSSASYLCDEVFGQPKTIFLRLKMLTVAPRNRLGSRHTIQGECSKKTFPITQYDHMDLTDSQLKDLLGFSSEQISFLKLLYLVDIESGKEIPFQIDEDFAKIRTIPMRALRHEAYYDCTMLDKRQQSAEDIPDEVKQEIRRDFDEILNCEFTQDELIVQWRENTEKKARVQLESGSILDLLGEESASNDLEREKPFVFPEDDIPVLSNVVVPRKSISAGAQLSSPKHGEHLYDLSVEMDLAPEPPTKETGITRNQIDIFYSKQMYAELDALRDTIESKKKRNPTIQQQLELQYELLSDEIEKKKAFLVDLFMEHDMNFSGSVTWVEYLSWRSKLWIDHQTKVAREKYFSGDENKVKPSDKILQETEKELRLEQQVATLQERR